MGACNSGGPVSELRLRLWRDARLTSGEQRQHPGDRRRVPATAYAGLPAARTAVLPTGATTATTVAAAVCATVPSTPTTACGANDAPVTGHGAGAEVSRAPSAARPTSTSHVDVTTLPGLLIAVRNSIREPRDAAVSARRRDIAKTEPSRRGVHVRLPGTATVTGACCSRLERADTS
jgi:hypothetical protein